MVYSNFKTNKFFLTYASVVNIIIYKTLLAIIAYLDLEVYYYDVVTAFLNALVKRDVYVM